jgi:hypothetical protein
MSVRFRLTTEERRLAHLLAAEARIDFRTAGKVLHEGVDSLCHWEVKERVARALPRVMPQAQT